MVQTIIDMDKIEKVLEFGLLSWVQVLESKIKDITPRDQNRLPNNPNIKVTWNLRRSISYEKIDKLTYKIWVRSWYFNTEKYWLYQEYWTSKLPQRSFIRKWIIENQNYIQNIINKSILSYLSKYK